MQSNESFITIPTVHLTSMFKRVHIDGWVDVFECNKCAAVVINMEKHELWHNLPQEPKRLGPSYMVDKLE